MSFRLGAREIGGGTSCFVIAEAGVNHNGDVALAHRLIDAACNAGADAVKFQTFKADRLASPVATKAAYQAHTTDTAESQLAMLRRLELTSADFAALKAHCEERGIVFLSTPFEAESADLLERLGVIAFKLPSGEVTNLPFLRHVARKGRPIIMSTGMSEMIEVTAAVDAIAAAGPAPLALLHCTSAYPADPAEANLRAMNTLSAAFRVPVGFSDHTPGVAVAIAAAALGATIIEKHFTLDRNLPGPDHEASLEPGELAALVSGIRSAQLALGDGVKQPTLGEADTARIARKSLVALRDLTPGMVIEVGMIAAMRPGTGISPAMQASVEGRRVARPVAAGAPLQWQDLA